MNHWNKTANVYFMVINTRATLIKAILHLIPSLFKTQDIQKQSN